MFLEKTVCAYGMNPSDFSDDVIITEKTSSVLQMQKEMKRSHNLPTYQILDQY